MDDHAPRPGAHLTPLPSATMCPQREAITMALACLGTAVAHGQVPAFTASQLASDHGALPARFTVFEVERFRPDTTGGSVFLANGYAGTALEAPETWTGLAGAQAVRITLVYSRYPPHWGPGTADHDRLLAERLQALFRVDSTLNSDELDWTLVLQHGATTEAEARALPHGVEITYVRTAREAPLVANVGTARYTELQLKRFEKQVLSFIKAMGPVEVPTMERVMERNPDWGSTLVIMDWTRTMQGHSAQAILWHIRNFATSGVRHMVLFTDGQRDKGGTIGDQGGIYYVDATDLKKLTKTMRMARAKAQNPDPEESDLEAIVRGTEHFTDVDRVTLIADNTSCIRDYCLLDRVRMPVHVVLCGVKHHVNPVYVNLAQRTGGSVHTADEDLDFHRDGATPHTVTLHGNTFTYSATKGRYVPKRMMATLRRRNCERYYDLDCTLEDVPDK